MSGRYERQAALATWQAAYITLPTSTTSDTFPATGVNTGGLDLNAFSGYMVSLKCTEAARVRGVATSTTVATAGDYPLEADVDYSFVIVPATRYLAVLSMGTAGTVYVAKTTRATASVTSL